MSVCVCDVDQVHTILCVGVSVLRTRYILYVGVWIMKTSDMYLG